MKKRILSRFIRGIFRSLTIGFLVLGAPEFLAFQLKAAFAAKLPAADPLLHVHLPLMMRLAMTGYGAATGRVVDAVTGNGLPDAQVCLGEELCATADVNGDFLLEGIPSGYRGLTATSPEYNPVTEFRMVLANQTAVYNFAMVYNLAVSDIDLRIVVTWDSIPGWTVGDRFYDNDLDAHLWLSVPNPPTHIFSGNRGECTSFPNACLPKDQVSGSGPETIDITFLEPNAIYYFGVHHYNYYFAPGSIPPLTELKPIIRIYDQQGLVYQFNGPATGVGDFWYGFMMDGNNGQITAMNCILNYTDDPPSCP